jgi:hypothetical protein
MSESTSQDWTKALVLVKQARAEMAAASALVKTLGDVTTSQPKEGEVEAKIAEAEQKRFEAAREKLQRRLSALQSSTKPPLAEIKSKVDELESAIKDADGLADKSDWPRAQQALYAALATADEAEQTAESRKSFNERAAKLIADAGTDVTLTGKVSDIVKAAQPVADKFDFAAAGRVLDSADATFQGEKVKKFAASNEESKLLTAVTGMMNKTGGSAAASGVKDGPKQLDDIVANLADSTPPDLIAKLAKARFGGLDLEVSKDESKGEQTQTLKSLYKTLAMTPDHVKDNPSLTKVCRIEPGKSGGVYKSEHNLTTMKGRPGKSDQKFGASLTKELGPRDPASDYGPVNDTPIDYFEFANVHETGHSVDDRLGFMASHMGDVKFGGWTTYGGNLEPIADAVARKYSVTLAAELKDFVLDLMTGAAPDNPPAKNPMDQSAIDDACKKIKSEWYENACLAGECWWSQTKCTAITIGDKIYHEAYKGTWVSYAAAERAKGITGYQFRAPAEWFAELFAAYHHKKLKPNHPAVGWLKTL